MKIFGICTKPRDWVETSLSKFIKNKEVVVLDYFQFMHLYTSNKLNNKRNYLIVDNILKLSEIVDCKIIDCEVHNGMFRSLPIYIDVFSDMIKDKNYEVKSNLNYLNYQACLVDLDFKDKYLKEFRDICKTSKLGEYEHLILKHMITFLFGKQDFSKFKSNIKKIILKVKDSVSSKTIKRLKSFIESLDDTSILKVCKQISKDKKSGKNPDYKKIEQDGIVTKEFVQYLLKNKRHFGNTVFNKNLTQVVESSHIDAKDYKVKATKMQADSNKKKSAYRKKSKDTESKGDK